jgi:hypothetical protein
VKSYALICDDPDAPGGTFTHWVLFNIPPGTTSLSEQVPTDEKLEGGAIQGKNDFDAIGYRGPCPPPGKPHHYHFHLFALDSTLDLDPGASRRQVLTAIEGHVLDEARLTGTFGRDT